MRRCRATSKRPQINIANQLTTWLCGHAQVWSWKGESATDPKRCYLKTGAALAHRHSQKGMTAGFPDGIAPPISPNPWYNNSRTVKLTIGRSSSSVAPQATTAKLRVVNSTCANPKKMWVEELRSVTWPSEAQLASLRLASEVCEEEVALLTDAVTGKTTVELTLEAYAAVELVVPTV